MVSIKMLNKRIQTLKKAVDEGINYDATDSELELLNQAMDSLNIVSKKLSPVKESIVNGQAAQKEYSNQKLLEDAGINMNPHDAIVQYIRAVKAQQNRQQQAQGDGSFQQQ